MSRKRCRRHVVVPLPPRGLRPKLAPGQVLDLGLAHHANLDAIAKGQADADTLWQVTGGMLTWHYVAQKLGAGTQEMDRQWGLCQALIDRWQRTGRVVFTGPELELAREGVAVMDQLAEIVDRPTAVEAAEWSEARVNAIAARAESQTSGPNDKGNRPA